MKLGEATALLKQTYTKWSEDKGPRLGAALAYYAIFSIPPLMLIAIAALGLVYSGNIVERLQVQLAMLVGDDTAKALLTGVQSKGQAGGVVAGLVGIGILLFGASGVFAELQHALNHIWGVKPKEQGVKGLIKGRFTAFTMVLGICFLLLVSLVISAVVAAVSERFSAWIPGGEAIGHILEMSASFLVITLLFAMIFKSLPDVKIRWGDVWIGAVVTALLFTLGKFAIGTYIGKAAIGSAYGAAGSIVILITWVYYSAQILYFGAEFTEVYVTAHGSRVVPAEDAEFANEEKNRLATAQGDVRRAEFPVVAKPAREPAASRPAWNYMLVMFTWLATALLLGRNKPADSKKRAA
jgi:membrane protein